MPELPEVETVRQTLDHLLKGKKISEVNVRYPNIVKQPESSEEFRIRLSGQTFQEVNRRGKFLVFSLTKDVLVSHLRMEGKYRVLSADEPLDKHTHVIFSLEGGEELRYNDVRKFGTMHLFSKGEAERSAPLNNLGPEPFDEAFTVEYLIANCHKTSRTIKQVLLDQRVIAGLGNIYADEVLYSAKIHPLVKADDLAAYQIEKLRTSIIEILTKAIELGGSTIRTYINSQGNIGQFQNLLKVYGHKETPCEDCGTEIIKIQSHGRGTHYCPTCQIRKADQP